MDGFTDDLWAIILARLPLKLISSSKLVCKKWKSILESPYFRNLFMSLHQNSLSSSWSLMPWNYRTEVLAHYGCNTWGLERSLGSYMSSFLTDKFKTQRDKYKVWAYTEVGFILISEDPLYKNNRSLYVANPVSQDCVELPSHAHLMEYSCPLGIATRTENGVPLDYKVVLFEFDGTHFKFLIYSSETGLWSRNAVPFPFSLSYLVLTCPISLQGNIHLLPTSIDNGEFISINVYASGTDSIDFRVTPFPDLGKHNRFRRTCTTCQGCLMYMNIIPVTKVDRSVEDKLCVWRLENWEWQLVFEITPSFIDIRFEYFPLGIHPFDAKTVYFWSKKHQSLMSINLSNGKFVLHSELESSRDGCTLSSSQCRRVMEYPIGFHFTSCVSPQWLHRIPRALSLSMQESYGIPQRLSLSLVHFPTMAASDSSRAGSEGFKMKHLRRAPIFVGLILGFVLFFICF